ncbi:type I-B CRISPR-associated protein Cas7/Csh2 [Stygiolobus caldivivus]|uniref:Type I-B CRISPR-associated protein Cas7/Csh2 n=1 Tax=Stygiolobus caldivivus TaxID=2824673 RepID=A0A8D5ZJ83_9CREN|nr:type I-B CRISPR-associated protein Cas7/Csh2 [Stygiolobus caldivivus]BCU70080.1 type I-B CRISPR-associated protein Cas7/Csh2 [Stygiolobus caldivivus]
MSKAGVSPTTNSEYLILYQVKNANPNGDPDDENRPRIDPKTKTNYVTDVRLKRFFRDYVVMKYGEDYVWVSTQEGKNVDATERFEHFGNDPDKVLDKCIDARLFGATIAKKGGSKGKGESSKGKGDSYAFTGPLQFTWGYSLHKVDLMDTRSITSILSGRESGSLNIGKDYRVYYSLIAFYGAFSWRRGKETKVTDKDLKVFDNFLWEAILHQSITRSKIGHTPLLYLRLEHKDPDTLIGDLRRFVTVKVKGENVRDISDLEVSVKGLVEKLNGKGTVYLRCNNDVIDNVCKELQGLNPVPLPHKGVTFP